MAPKCLLLRIRGRYVKSDALFAACHSARWLVLRGVISHCALHHPLLRNLAMETITHPTLVQLSLAQCLQYLDCWLF